MPMDSSRDYFDKARAFAAGVLALAGAAAIAGTFMPWVTIAPPAIVPDDQAHRLAVFTGAETPDGRIVLIASGVLVLCALLVVVRKKSFYGWIAFVTAILIGGISIGDWRGIDQLFYDEMNRIGDPTPSFGLGLVAAAGLAALIGSVTAVAATPARD